MNLNKMIFNVTAIGLQKYLETDMIMRLNVLLCSYAAFSCLFLPPTFFISKDSENLIRNVYLG